MEPFLLTLPDDTLLSGLVSVPQRTPCTPRYCPLIVAIHGGTYSSSYFDASPSYSAATFSAQLGVPFVAIDRPGYRDSSALASIPENSSFFQEEGRKLHQEILPKIWETYGQPAGASTIVLIGHSLGCSAPIIAAALHSRGPPENQYPLAGVILSGRSTTSAMTKAQGEKQLAEAGRVGYVEFPPGVKDILMFGQAKFGLATEDIRRISEEITHRGLVAEFSDRRLQWEDYWLDYAKDIKIPLLAAVGDRDGLFHASADDLREFTKAFTNSPKVETVFVPGAPHCLELSHWGTSWYSRCFGFAIECATCAALR